MERLLEAASERGVRDRALLELLYAAGLRVSEAIGLDREDLSLDGAFVRVIGKGDKERLVPIGEVALDWLVAWLDGTAAGPPGTQSRGARPRRTAVPRRSRRAAWPASRPGPR